MRVISGVELASCGRSLPAQFVVSLGGGTTLSVTQILRLLPGKRLTCRAKYEGRMVLVKLFFGSAYSRHCSREIEGVGYIEKAGVNTPRLILSAEDPSQQLAFALFEFLQQAETLQNRWLDATTEQAKKDVFKQALGAIAQLHNHSVYQKDIHLNNFLLCDGRLYLIDGGQVFQEKAKDGVGVKESTTNVALFFAQFFPWEDSWLDVVFNYYLEARNRSLEMPIQEVKNKVIEQRERRERKYIDNKIFRRCSEFNTIKNWSSYCVFSRIFDEKDVEELINNPDRFIERGRVLKSGRSATVAKIDFAGRTYIIKRYNKKSASHRLARSLLDSRAVVSWRNGHLLTFNGIPTAAPLLVFEQRFGVMRAGSYVVTEYIEGEHAFNFFSRDDQSEAAKLMAEKIAQLIKRLHQSGFNHGDLKSHNIWISGDKPLLIDLDGMKRNRGKKRQLKLVKKDWLRLHRDLGNSVIASILFSGQEWLND